jgi:hypothetical protein
MNKRLLTGAVGMALYMLTTPANARLPFPDGDRLASQPYEDGTSRQYERGVDEPVYRTERRRSRDSGARKARRDTPKRSRPVDVARTSTGQDNVAASTGEDNVAASTREDNVAARSVTGYARGAGGLSGACLTAPARELLERIQAQFGPVQIVSTCRPGARIAGTGRISKHASGEAIDFNAGNRKAEIVRWLIANHKTGGTMTYAGMSHVHVDIGYHFVALNSGGRRR